MAIILAQCLSSQSVSQSQDLEVNRMRVLLDIGSITLISLLISFLVIDQRVSDHRL